MGERRKKTGEDACGLVICKMETSKESWPRSKGFLQPGLEGL